LFVEEMESHMTRTLKVSAYVVPLVFGIVLGVYAQQPAAPGAGQEKGKGGKGKGPARPALFFREEWKQTAAGGEHPVGPADAVSNPNLELKLYGDAKNFLLTGAAGDDSNPIHLWTGTCATTCAATLRDKNNFVDLTGLARIRWVTKTSGFQKVHPVVKLASGTMLVGDHADGSTTDWQENEFSVSDVRWMTLDPEKVVTKGNFVPNPDLSKVDEVGFTDLMPGSGHGPGGWSDVGKIEVYGKAVPR
jgi:hypothetical protein